MKNHLTAGLDLALHNLSPPFSTLPGLLNSLSSWTPEAILRAPDAEPLHLPLALSLAAMPACFVLNVLTGNLSWVDRIYTTWPVLCSACVAAWVWVHPGGEVYGACLPRLALILGIQAIWFTRLTYHTARRGLYWPRSEDYRYGVMRKILPWWALQLVHVFAVVIAQPLLLYYFCVPVGITVRPPDQMSAGPGLAIPYSAVLPFLPARFATAVVSRDTPVLNLYDLFCLIGGLVFITLEGTADQQMYTYQESKHALMTHTPDDPNVRTPQRVVYPASHHPGFPVHGLFGIVRHPNFASEQGFWLSQAFFPVAAGLEFARGQLKSVLGPTMALSLLMVMSTAITEWITTRKYPVYSSYQKVVGQFYPMQTVFRRLWAFVTGTYRARMDDVYGGAGQAAVNGKRKSQ